MFEQRRADTGRITAASGQIPREWTQGYGISYNKPLLPSHQTIQEMSNQFGDRLAAILALSFVLIAPAVQPPWVLSIMILLFSSTLFLIRKTRYLALALIPIAILYGLSLLPLLVFSCTFTIMVKVQEKTSRGRSERP